MRAAVAREATSISGLSNHGLEQRACQMLAKHDGQQVLEHRHANALSFAADIAMTQGCHRNEGDLQADGAIGVNDGRIARLGRSGLERQPGGPDIPWIKSS